MFGFLNLGRIFLMLRIAGIGGSARRIVCSKTAVALLVAYIRHRIKDLLLGHLLATAITGRGRLGILDAERAGKGRWILNVRTANCAVSRSSIILLNGCFQASHEFRSLSGAWCCRLGEGHRSGALVLVHPALATDESLSFLTLASVFFCHRLLYRYCGILLAQR